MIDSTCSRVEKKPLVLCGKKMADSRADYFEQTKSRSVHKRKTRKLMLNESEIIDNIFQKNNTKRPFKKKEL